MSEAIKKLLQVAPMDMQTKAIFDKVNELVERSKKQDDEIDRLKTKTRPC